MTAPSNFLHITDLPLKPVTVVCGHYGVGKTNLSLNLAIDAAQAGSQVTLIDLDVVNPYFRSSEYAELLKAHGVRLISPVFAQAGSNLDVPSLTGAILPAVEAAQEEPKPKGTCPLGSGSPKDTSPRVPFPSKLVIIDAGGDDAGSTALGRFAHAISQAPYAMLYVVNHYRNLTQSAEEAVALLPEIEEQSHLRATALINNSHLKGETKSHHIEAAWDFGFEVAEKTHLPLVAITAPVELCLPETSCVFPARVTQYTYPVQIYVRTPWE